MLYILMRERLWCNSQLGYNPCRLLVRSRRDSFNRELRATRFLFLARFLKDRREVIRLIQRSRVFIPLWRNFSIEQSFEMKFVYIFAYLNFIIMLAQK